MKKGTKNRTNGIWVKNAFNKAGEKVVVKNRKLTFLIESTN